ncbi:MAG: hypothetical protein WAN75_06185 [Xanthobacteraceae bacterium]|jgi:hypothetical protein
MNQHVPIGTALVAKPSFPKTNLDLDVALCRSPTTSMPERKREVRLFALWPFILVVAVLAMIAVISDGPSTPDQRIQVFQLSGTYP